MGLGLAGLVRITSYNVCYTKLLRPLGRVLGVVGFYAFLSSQPVGRYQVLFSDNITDRMLGNMDLLTALCEKLWVRNNFV